MKRVLGFGAALLGIMAAAACTGPAGPAGPAGADGKDGTNGTGGSAASPSVSAVNPSSAFLGRTLDLTIAGNGTAWSSSTTVSFADPKITVNKVTAASATGLLVNITVGKDATVAATDVTVKDGSNSEVYKGAFAIKSPLKVTTDPASGIPQGGIGAVHLQGLDTQTPFDTTSTYDDNFNLVYPNIAISAPAGFNAAVTNVTDYGIDATIYVDVLATTGTVDLDVVSGPTGNTTEFPGAGATTLAARTPTVLSAAQAGSGTLSSFNDTALYSFAPAAATARFVLFNISSADDGAPEAIVIPKSGKFFDYVNIFGVRYGKAVTSTDTSYLVATDSGNGASTPYGFDLSVSETVATIVAEQSSDHDSSTNAQDVSSSLPAVVQGDLDTSDDWYAVTVSGASAGSPKTIHVASGGDVLSAVAIEITDSDGNTLATDGEDDLHVEASTDATADGTYYVHVAQGYYYDSSHSTYDLLLEVK